MLFLAAKGKAQMLNGTTKDDSEEKKKLTKTLCKVP